MTIFRPTLLVAAALTLVGACVPGPTVTDPAAQASLVAQECAIYLAAEQTLTAQGRGTNGALAAGCPEGISAGNIAATGTAGLATPFSEILFQRMIARGMPRDLAEQVSTSTAFKDLVAFQAANAS